MTNTHQGVQVLFGGLLVINPRHGLVNNTAETMTTKASIELAEEFTHLGSFNPRSHYQPTIRQTTVAHNGIAIHMSGHNSLQSVVVIKHQ